MKNFKYIYTIVAFVFLAACGYEPEVERAGTRPDLSTTDVLDARGYNILLEAINHAGLDEVLQGSDSLTLLAPTDLAFEALLNSIGAARITDVAPEAVAAILSYHVIAAPAFSASLPRSITALDGNTLYFSSVGGVNINGKATVVQPDLVSNTAVIHGINRVLDVPAGNMLEQMEANDSLSVLVSAIESAGIQSLFTGATQYTVFAPTNSAFDGVDISSLTPEQLVEILGFHVIAGVSFSQELPESARIATIQGNSVDDNVQEIIKSGASLNGSALIAFNSVANNGVIHTVSDIISKRFTAADVFGPTNVTGNDTFGYDQFGTVINGVGYPLSVADTLSYYAPLFGLTYADFASDEEATEYIENHIFEGLTNIWTLANGTKITSINGSQYYMVVATAADGRTFRRVNGGAVRNAFTSGGVSTTTTNSAYFTLLGLPRGSFTPLPEENIIEVLSANADYSLFVALVERLGLTATLSGGNYTVFPVADAAFTAGSGLATVAEIEALDDEADAGLLADLEEIALNHVVASANFSAFIIGSLPSLETAGGTSLNFAYVIVDGVEQLAIVTDATDPNNENVQFVSLDIQANNGVIHEVDGFISF